jgi:uncharacterized protein (TIGR04255 family)
MSKQNTRLPDYKNPPLIEVAISVGFEYLKEFQSSYIGDLWSQFGRDDFPHIEDHQPIGFPDTNPLKEIPRVWFLNEDKTELTQFQRNRLVFNWRITNDNIDAPYIRYGEIADKFFDKLQKLEKFVQDNLGSALAYNGMELAYINSIPFESFGATAESIGTIGNCMNDVCWQEGKSFLQPPSKFGGIWEFEAQDLNGSLVVNMASLDEFLGQPGPALRLDMKASGIYAPPFDNGHDNMLKWYDKAHEYIVLGFDDLTSPAMHTKEKWYKT